MTKFPVNRIRVDDLDVAYTWRGHADRRAPLLFLHGLGDSSIITFDRIASDPALADRASLLIDLPGYGHSPVADTWPATIEKYADIVVAVCEALSLSEVTIIGHSMGGSIAIQVATQSPELISRLILAEPLLRPEQSRLGASIGKRTENEFVERGFSMLELATRRRAIRGDIAAQSFQEPLSRAQPRIMHRSASSLLQNRSPTFYELLARMSILRTIVIGKRTNIASGILVPKEVNVEVIPDAGHSMMSENPEAFVEVVAKALNDGPGN